MEFFLGAFTQDWERRRAAILHERSMGAGRRDDEEEWRKRGGGASADAGSLPGRMHPRGKAVKTGIGYGRKRAERSMAKRFHALARGSQPAVVKMASFGGGSRLGALASYVSRDGEVALENEIGQQLRGRGEVLALKESWAHVMSGRAESRDIGVFRVDIASGMIVDTPKARQILAAAFGDRPFVFTLTDAKDEQSQINGVVVLRDSKGERLTADSKAAKIIQARIDAALQASGGEVGLHFVGHGNGVRYGTSRVRHLVETASGLVQDELGRRIGDAKQAGDLVQLEWREKLHSRRPRDVMHLVMSARAGTDSEKFHEAARQFLAAEFAGHRYVFALHDPTDDPKDRSAGGKRPHVHLHAIVAMRSDAGARVETNIASFRRWREGLAKSARENGIAMEMTDRRELSAAPAFTRKQVRPTDRSARTQFEGTSEFAQRRYERKSHEARSIASTESAKDYTEIARIEWENLRRDTRSDAVGNFAKARAKQMETAIYDRGLTFSGWPDRVNMGSHFRTEMVTLRSLMEIDDMSAMTRLEFEAYEKRVETALVAAQKTASIGEQDSLADITAAVRAHIDVRRELMERAEIPRERAQDQRSGRADVADDAREQWGAAVARHGPETVKIANEAMLKVEEYREAIQRLEADDVQADKRSLQAGLQRELARTAELGVAGNTMIKAIGEFDAELQRALVVAERARDQSRATSTKSESQIDRSDGSGDPGQTDRQGRGLDASQKGQRGDALPSGSKAQNATRDWQVRENSADAIRRDRDDIER